MFKSRVLIYSILALLAVLQPVLALAQDAMPKLSPPAAKWERRNNQLILVFSDGREATLTQTIRKPTRLSIKLSQTENTCAPSEALVRCVLKTDVSPYLISILWSKNPDASKLGQVVKYDPVYAGETDKVELSFIDFSLLFQFDTRKFPQYQSLFQKDELSCDSMNWLKAAAADGKTAKISSWSSEAMRPNVENGVDENLSISAAYNVELALTSDKSSTLEKIGSFYQLDEDLFPPYMGGNIINMNFIKGDGTHCQTAFELDLVGGVAALRTNEFRQTNPSMRRTDIAIKSFSASRIRGKTYVLTTPGMVVKGIE